MTGVCSEELHPQGSAKLAPWPVRLSRKRLVPVGPSDVGGSPVAVTMMGQMWFLPQRFLCWELVPRVAVPRRW